MTHFLDALGANDFAVRQAIILALVSLAVYVLLNAGIFATPQIGFLAIGAYASTAMSLDFGQPFPVALAVAGGSGLVTGVVLAALLARLNGIYLAIATIAFSAAVNAAILVLPFTGNALGRVGIPREANDFYIIGAVLVAVLALWLMSRSHLGIAMVAMREDPLMAAHQRINVRGFRVALFGLSGLLCGVAGALLVHMSGYVEPSQFDFGLLTQMIAATVIGGMTYISGSIVGTLIVTGLPLVLTGLADYQTVVDGLLIAAVVGYAKVGLVGYIAKAVQALRRRGQTDPPTPSTHPQAALDDQVRTPPPQDAPPTLALEEIALSFGGIKALQGVSLEVRPGELLGVIGPNGSGKTSLLNVISGVYVPDSGDALLSGSSVRSLAGHPYRLARRGIARTFQTIRLIEGCSAADNVRVGLHGVGHRGSEVRHVLADLLARHGLAEYAEVEVSSLPYGLRRRVEIARAVAAEPAVLLLDEPTAGMNPEERDGVFQMVDALRANGMAVIVIEHDVAMMAQYCDRLVVLDFGRVLAAGDPEVVLRSDEVVAAYVG